MHSHGFCADWCVSVQVLVKKGQLVEQGAQLVIVAAVSSRFLLGRSDSGKMLLGAAAKKPFL